jgi:hypothetical protein
MPKRFWPQVRDILDLIRAGWTPKKTVGFAVALLLVLWAIAEVWSRL